MEEENNEVNRIVQKYENIKSEFSKNLLIWEEIAMNINSTNGKENVFWINVMKAYSKITSSKE